MLVALTHTLYQEFDMTKTIRKGIEMEHKDLSMETVLSLQQQLEDAIENRECFLIGGDWNMVKLWDEQIEFIIEKIKAL